MGMQYAGHDTSLASAFQLILPSSGGSVQFQFPPVVKGDGRKGQWKEVERRGKEPAAAYIVAGPRTFSIKITYICDGGTWDASKIATQIQAMRGYFMVDTGQAEKLVAQIQCWQIGGQELMTCRLVSCDVTYSETLVGQGNNAFPLRSDVSLDVRLWSKDVDGQNVQGLQPKVLQDWF